MPNIILKKTFKYRQGCFAAATEQLYAFSFHGSIAPATIDEINRILTSDGAKVYTTPGANKPQFKLDAYGHYFAEMNILCQMHHEEDLLVAILDGMEKMGFVLFMQCDSVTRTEKCKVATETAREMFLFRPVPKSSLA